MHNDATPALPRRADTRLNVRDLAEQLERIADVVSGAGWAVSDRSLSEARLFVTSSDALSMPAVQSDTARAAAVLEQFGRGDADPYDAAWALVRAELQRENAAGAAIRDEAEASGLSPEDAAAVANYRVSTELHPATIARLAQLVADLMTALLADRAARASETHAPARPFEALTALLSVLFVALATVNAALTSRLDELEPPPGTTPNTSPRAARAPGLRVSA